MQRLWFTSPSGPVGAAVKTGSVRTCFPFPLPFEMSGTRLEEILVEGVKEVRVNVCECPWLELASMGTAGHAGCLPACCLPLSLGTQGPRGILECGVRAGLAQALLFPTGSGCLLSAGGCRFHKEPPVIPLPTPNRIVKPFVLLNSFFLFFSPLGGVKSQLLGSG